jgi:hypothetical protein
MCGKVTIAYQVWFKLQVPLYTPGPGAAATTQHSEGDDIPCSRDEFEKPGQTSNLPSPSIMPVDARPGSNPIGLIHELWETLCMISDVFDTSLRNKLGPVTV